MNLQFSPLNVATTSNVEGATLSEHDREFFRYTRQGYSTLIEGNYANGCLYMYRTPLSTPLPSGMSAEDVYSEIFAAAQTLTDRNVVWGPG